MLVRFITLLALLSVVQSVHAQFRYNSDYYFDRSDNLLKQQLPVVELHLAPCTQEYQERRYRPAYDDCKFILNYFPNHPQALLLMAQVCEAWKDARCDTEGFFERAILVNPNIGATYSVIGVSLLRAKKVSSAIDNLKKAADLDPNSVNAHYNLGLAYFESKQFELANEHAQRAYQLGAPLPGLRDKLKKSGHWKPPESTSPERSSSNSAPR